MRANATPLACSLQDSSSNAHLRARGIADATP
jgi:hypothetical protein